MAEKSAPVHSIVKEEAREAPRRGSPGGAAWRLSEENPVCGGKGECQGATLGERLHREPRYAQARNLSKKAMRCEIEVETLGSDEEDRDVGETGRGRRLRLDPELLELGPADGDADRLLVAKYSGRLGRYFVRLGFSGDMAGDLTQETFLRVFRSDAMLRSRTELEAWLFRIAKNVALNTRRGLATKKRVGVEVSIDEPAGSGGDGEVPLEIADAAPDPRSELLHREQLERLRAAIGTLPEQMRRCVWMHVYQNLDSKDIATALRIKADTVKSHIHQGKKKLRELLGDELGPLDL